MPKTKRGHHATKRSGKPREKYMHYNGGGRIQRSKDRHSGAARLSQLSEVPEIENKLNITFENVEMNRNDESKQCN